MHCPKSMCFVHTQIFLVVVPAVQCRTTWNNNEAARITFYAYTAARIGSYLHTRNLLLLKMFPASNTFMNSTSCNLNTWAVSHVCSAQAYCNWLVLLIKSTAWQGNPIKESLSLTFKLDGRVLYVFLTVASSRNHILWVMDRSQGWREPNFCLPLPNRKWEKINVRWVVQLANITSEPFPVIQQKDLGKAMDTETLWYKAFCKCFTRA